GAFLAAGGILANHTAEAVREYEKELERFAAEGPTDPELATAKETLIRGLPAALETDDAVASALATTVFNGLPRDYYRTVPQRIAKVSRSDAARVARTWIRPRQWPVVVVGPIGGAADALQALALGEVRIHSAPGVLEVRPGTAQAGPGLQGPAPDSQPPTASCQEIVSQLPSSWRTQSAVAGRPRERGTTEEAPGGEAAVVQARTRGSKVMAAVSNVFAPSDQVATTVLRTGSPGDRVWKGLDKPSSPQVAIGSPTST